MSWKCFRTLKETSEKVLDFGHLNVFILRYLLFPKIAVVDLALMDPSRAVGHRPDIPIPVHSVASRSAQIEHNKVLCIQAEHRDIWSIDEVMSMLFEYFDG